MKKAIALTLALLFALSVSARAEETKLRCGAFLEEVESSAWWDLIESKGDETPDFEAEEYVILDSLHQMLMALRADDIDYFYMTDASARYILAHTSDLAIVEEPFITFGYRMAVLPENRTLCERLSEAMLSLRADGRLQALTDTWIVPNADELAATVLPYAKDAETVRVGVTGDLPPIDYAAADGTPSGYNVALLSALSETMGVNFELVPVSPSARLLALTSGKIDAMFWMESYRIDDEVLDLGTVVMTPCYFSDTSALILKQESVERVTMLLGLDKK